MHYWQLDTRVLSLVPFCVSLLILDSLSSSHQCFSVLQSSVKLGLSGWIVTVKRYVSGEAAVSERGRCYCQELALVLLCSRSSVAGQVHARCTSSRPSPRAQVRTGDRTKAMGPYVSRRK